MAEIMKLDQARHVLVECGCYRFEERVDDRTRERYLAFKHGDEQWGHVLIWNQGDGDFVLADDVRKICQVSA
jgi:hypothetical protein